MASNPHAEITVAALHGGPEAVQRFAWRHQRSPAEMRQLLDEGMRAGAIRVECLDHAGTWRLIELGDFAAGVIDWDTGLFHPRTIAMSEAEGVLTLGVAPPMAGPGHSIRIAVLAVDEYMARRRMAQPPARPAARTGRPPKYDWRAAATWAGAWVFHNGKPEPRSQLVEYLADRFAAIGEAPDDRDLRRLVDELLAEIELSEGRGK